MQFNQQPQVEVDIPIDIPDNQVKPELSTIPTLTEDDVIVVDNAELEMESGWEASFELAKIAKEKDIDLSTLSREEYADFAIEHSLAIGDKQLRAATWQRNATSLDEMHKWEEERKQKIDKDLVEDFSDFALEVKKCEEEGVPIFERIEVAKGTLLQDNWLHFIVNGGVSRENTEVYKSYISVKDLNTLTPKRFKFFMFALRDFGYHGNIKIFQDILNIGLILNDQIVMHGTTKEDAELALRIAENFFGNDIYQKNSGVDIIRDGKPHKTYSQILAEKIKEAIRKKKEVSS
jgi:hypothetical protein